jgi:hypothetical protein
MTLHGVFGAIVAHVAVDDNVGVVVSEYNIVCYGLFVVLDGDAAGILFSVVINVEISGLGFLVNLIEVVPQRLVVIIGNAAGSEEFLKSLVGVALVGNSLAELLDVLGSNNIALGLKSDTYAVLRNGVILAILRLGEVLGEGVNVGKDILAQCLGVDGSKSVEIGTVLESSVSLLVACFNGNAVLYHVLDILYGTGDNAVGKLGDIAVSNFLIVVVNGVDGHQTLSVVAEHIIDAGELILLLGFHGKGNGLDVLLAQLARGGSIVSHNSLVAAVKFALGSLLELAYLIACGLGSLIGGKLLIVVLSFFRGSGSGLSGSLLLSCGGSFGSGSFGSLSINSLIACCFARFLYIAAAGSADRKKTCEKRG